MSGSLNDTVVVYCSAVIKIQSAFYACFGERRLYELCCICNPDVYAEVAQLYEHLSEILHFSSICRPELIKRAVIGRSPEIQTDAASAETVASVIQSVFEDLCKV